GWRTRCARHTGARTSWCPGRFRTPSARYCPAGVFSCLSTLMDCRPDRAPITEGGSSLRAPLLSPVALETRLALPAAPPVELLASARRALAHRAPAQLAGLHAQEVEDGVEHLLGEDVLVEDAQRPD